MKIHSVRGRSLAAAVASLALLGAGSTISTTPAQSAAPAPDCREPYPIADLTDDQPVTGLTVSRGTTPEGFTGKVLGVLKDGIAPTMDMVMVELTDAGTAGEIDKKGIWAGMSGSPVYAEDGRLIGAVAYGLAWGPSPVAGVTPYEYMNEYMGAPAAAPGRIAVSDREARAIARETDLSARQAGEGFRQLPMPLQYNGISSARLHKMKKKGPDYLHRSGVKVSRLGGGVSGTAAVSDDLVAGGNLGAAISYGTVTLGGVGTVTSVCDGRLIGFGHPMTWGGRTTLGMMPADALFVQDDLITSFKVSNMGTPAGTIDQDRLTGISGDLGVMPDETDVASGVTYGTRHRDGESYGLVKDYNADVVFSQVLAMHDVTVDSIQPGSEAASFTISGTDADGQSFDIAFGDRYTSDWDIAFEGIWDIADAVWILSGMDDVTLDHVTTSADVTDGTDQWRVRTLEQRRGDHWVKLGRRHQAVVRPGRALRVRAVLRNGDATTTVPLSLRVPRQARREGYLELRGGASVGNSALYRADTPAEVKRALEHGVRNDQVQLVLHLAKRGRDLRVRTVSESQDLVVRGSTYSGVTVRH